LAGPPAVALFIAAIALVAVLAAIPGASPAHESPGPQAQASGIKVQLGPNAGESGAVPRLKDLLKTVIQNDEKNSS
jgi:hypothetical protein